MLISLGMVTLMVNASFSQTVKNPFVPNDKVWMKVQDTDPSFSKFYEGFKDQMGLKRPSSLRVIKDWTDDLGMRHVRGQQMIEGVPVERTLWTVNDPAGQRRIS